MRQSNRHYHDPFRCFREWSEEFDRRAYASLTTHKAESRVPSIEALTVSTKGGSKRLRRCNA